MYEKTETSYDKLVAGDSKIVRTVATFDAGTDLAAGAVVVAKFTASTTTGETTTPKTYDTKGLYKQLASTDTEAVAGDFGILLENIKIGETGTGDAQIALTGEFDETSLKWATGTDTATFKHALIAQGIFIKKVIGEK